MHATHFLEALESRTHLSATLSRRGILYVVGTHGNDTITICVERGHRNVIQVNVNHQKTATFKASTVKSIIVQGGRGNDHITISDRNGHVGGRHFIYGGAGDDYIVTDSDSDYVDGGAPGEDDTVVLPPDDNTTPPATQPTDSNPPATQPTDGGDSGGGDDFGDTGSDDDSSGGDF